MSEKPVTIELPWPGSEFDYWVIRLAQYAQGRLFAPFYFSAWREMLKEVSPHVGYKGRFRGIGDKIVFED